MSNTPSNEELDALIAEYRTRIYPQDMQPRFERAIMRAAIAKWGTPAPVGVEPVPGFRALADELYARGYEDRQKERDYDPRGSDAWQAVVDAAFQALAMGRVPLTDGQIKDLQDDGVFLGSCRQIVRAIEAAHGIKGGKPCA